MPELPEVQTVVTTLIPRVVGATVVGVDVLRPDYISPRQFDLSAALTGHRISAIHRRGKRIIFTVDTSDHFLIHLGMTGRLTIEPAQSRRILHTHVVLTLKPPAGRPFELHLRDPRRFGQLLWLGADTGESGLGPEPLGISAASLCRTLSSSRRPIKSLLLDQTRLAGLGNIYADESLFLAGVHPLIPANRLGELASRKLCRAIKQVLRKAIRHRGSTLRDYVDAQGGKGAFQLLHNVYDRAGKPCRKCRRPIERLVISGRSSCYCPACQPTRPA